MDKYILDGTNLTIELVATIANDQNCEIEIAEHSIEKLKKARKLVFDLVDEGEEIYGFNTGVGWNKDQAVFSEFFQEYNTDLVLSHCVAAGEYLTETETRAVLLSRLNGLLSGCTGASLEVVNGYVNFINKGISPIIPRSGSVGVGDITNLSHIGLAMLGEGEVYYQGRIIVASEALQQCNLEIVELGPKDGLAIVSSNAYASGIAALMLKDAKDLMDMSSIVLATTFDGYNANTSPIELVTFKYRNYPVYSEYSKKLNKHLEGSSVYISNPNKPVQDPLSFRDALHINASAIDAINNLEELLTIQLNSSDDNPCLLLEKRKIISCCNFETINWVLAVEELGQYLSHVSKLACYRMIKLCNPDFSNLPRFLTVNNDVLGFATLQKTYCSLDSEIRFLSNPASLDFIAVAGDIEDRGNNTPYVVNKTAKIIDNLYYIFGLEMMHACQAIDLRTDHNLGRDVKVSFNKYRKTVTKYIEDRIISDDIEKSYQFMKSKVLLEN